MEAVARQVLDAAESLFYSRGVQSVGVDEIRAAAGVSLKRLYQLFPSKEELVQAYLQRRDRRWRESLASYVSAVEDPDAGLLAVFDWLHAWFAEPGFRGCAWINCFGELGATSPAVVEEARRHKLAVRQYLGQLVETAGRPAELADQLYLLAEGAMVAAAVFADADAALRARRAATLLLDA